MARRYGGRLAMVWIREPHEDGTLHVHALLDRYVPQSVLSETWVASGGGRIADIRFVDPHRVINYLVKYLAKSPRPLPDGVRRYGATGGVKLAGVYPGGGSGWWVTSPVDGGDWRWLPDPGPEIGRILARSDGLWARSDGLWGP
jgi:hypothetical protein